MGQRDIVEKCSGFGWSQSGCDGNWKWGSEKWNFEVYLLNLKLLLMITNNFGHWLQLGSPRIYTRGLKQVFCGPCATRPLWLTNLNKHPYLSKFFSIYTEENLFCVFFCHMPVTLVANFNIITMYNHVNNIVAKCIGYILAKHHAKYWLQIWSVSYVIQWMSFNVITGYCYQPLNVITF